ncbi:MAG: hypothetical protein OEQ29_08920 [Alphaproteobacteria bacterium]|nr:hypothetical protein [Alphaproteobacteria bacterium]
MFFDTPARRRRSSTLKQHKAGISMTKSFDIELLNWSPATDSTYTPKTDAEFAARDHNIEAIKRCLRETSEQLDEKVEACFSPDFMYYLGAQNTVGDFAFLGMEISLGPKTDYGINGDGLCFAISFGTSKNSDEWIYTDLDTLIADFNDRFADEPDNFPEMVPLLRAWADSLESIAANPTRSLSS